MNALVLAVDRWHAGFVGAYGNTWIETPWVDRWAAEGCVFDQYLIDSPRLETLYRSYWHGLHAMTDASPGGADPSLADQLAESGVHTALVTDEPAVRSHALATGFAERIELPGPAAEGPAEAVELTHLGTCFARLVEWLETAPQPFLAWCHWRAFGQVWDAPFEWRARWVEPGDPEPTAEVRVPCRHLEKDYDPDELLVISYAYAAQAVVLDSCLGALAELLETTSLGRRTLVVLLSVRGFPLGEHRRVGSVDDALYGELVQVPLIIRPPEDAQALRAQVLVQPPDLWATLLDWWGLARRSGPTCAASLLPVVRDQARLPPALPMGPPGPARWPGAEEQPPASLAGRHRVCLTDGAAQKAIRTPAWYLRHDGNAELFVKPDDRWEANNVADRCPQVVEELRAALAEHENYLRAGCRGNLSPLGDVLVHGIE